MSRLVLEITAWPMLVLVLHVHSWAEQKQPAVPMDASPDGTQEIRALWVVRHELASPTSIVRMVDRARNCHFTTLLVQVRGRDDAFYKSNIVTMAEPLLRHYAQYDPLQLAIEKGHEAGLEVHAWVNVYMAWSAPYPPEDSAHVLYEHPEWFAQSIDGVHLAYCHPEEYGNNGAEGRYLSPAIPGVRDYLLRVVTEIVQHYDIDGLHLDYVRYPSEDFDYGAESISQFRNEFRVDPRTLHRAKYDAWALSDRNSKLWDKWLQWRADQVTELVRSIREMIQATKPHIKLSAAVKPDIEEAYRVFGQAWAEWVNGGLIDFAVPMMYARRTDVVIDQLAHTLSLVPAERFYVGIGLHTQPLSSALEKIQTVRTRGIRAFSLFSYAELAEEYEAFVASGVFGP